MFQSFRVTVFMEPFFKIDGIIADSENPMESQWDYQVMISNHPTAPKDRGVQRTSSMERTGGSSMGDIPACHV